MNQQSIERYLTNHEFFSGLDSSFIQFLSGNATEQLAKEGDVLFHQGEPADKFYLFLSGQVRVYIPALMGPNLEIQTLKKDQILGWSWLIPPYRWTFQAQAIEDCRLLEFNGPNVLGRCEEDSEFGYTVMKRFTKLMSERLDAARRKMMEQWDPPGFA